MEDSSQKICIWKKVADRDDEKRKKGDYYITLRKDKPCYNCDGTREKALELECNKYMDSEE